MIKSSNLIFLFIPFFLIFFILFTGCEKNITANHAVSTDENSSDSAAVETAAEPKSEPSVSPIERSIINYFTNISTYDYKVSPQVLILMVAADADVCVIDIRETSDYTAGHVQGAVSVPWGPFFAETFEKIPSGMPVYVYSSFGQTAGQAVLLLSLAGFEAYSIDFGWDIGLSNAEGISAVTSLQRHFFPDEDSSAIGSTRKIAPIDTDILTAIDDYFVDMQIVSDTVFKDFLINTDALKRLIDERSPNLFLLSVRDPADYAVGHIPGAVNLPWNNNMVQALDILPKNRRIVVYSNTGQWSAQTGAALRLLGYDAVSLYGGMGTDANIPLGWSNKGYPLVQ